MASAPTPSTRRFANGTITQYDDDELLVLPAQEHSDMLTQIHATVAVVLDSMAGDGPSHTFWRPKGTKKNVSYFVDDNVLADQYRFCCVAETSAHTEDLMKLFLMTDTETLLKHNRAMYNNILDARVLSVLEKPTRTQPYRSVYLRYSSFATPTLMDDRDMCVLVATDVFTHDDGSTIGYCLWDSVDIDACPDYHKSRGLVRSRMFRSGFFFRTSHDSLDGSPQTKIVYLVGLEAGGATPRLAAWLVMEKFGANLSRLCSHFRRRHLDPTTFRPRSEWPSPWNVKQCRGCVHALGRLTIRHNCVACGNVFCKPCLVKEQVDVPGVGITRVRFCLNCLDVRGLDDRRTTSHHHATDSSRSTTATSARANSRAANRAGSTASIKSSASSTTSTGSTGVSVAPYTELPIRLRSYTSARTASPSSSTSSSSPSTHRSHT